MLPLLGLVLFLLPTYLVRFSVFGIPTTVLEVLIYVAFLWLLISKPVAYSIDRLKPVVKHFGLPIVLLLISAAFATMLAPEALQALGLFKAYILDPILLFIVIIVSVDTKAKLRALVFSLIASGVLVAISSFLGTTNAEDRTLGIYTLDETASPNFLALYLSPLAIVSLVSVLYEKNQRVKLSLALAFLLMIIALVISGSRGGLLATGVGTGLSVLVWLQSKTKATAKPLLIGLGVGFLIAVATTAWWLGKPSFESTPSHRVATSNNLRYEIWRTTVVDILPQKALNGVGLGNYQNYFTELTRKRVNFPEFIAPWALTPHNIFLTIWVNLGLLGLAAFLWLLILYFRFLSVKEVWQDPLAKALTLAMITLLVHGLVDSPYWKNDLSALFWVLLAMSYLTYHLSVDEVDNGA